MLIYGFPSRYQTRHNFVGGIRIFSVKICINPYPSSMHRCIATLFTRFVSRCSLQKIATLHNKNRQPVAKTRCYRTKNWSRRNWSFTSRGATVAPRSITPHRRRNLPFFGNLAEKATCVDDKTVVSLHILNNLFFSNLPQIRITT